MDGERTSEEIARLASEKFPERFADGRAALTRVGDLAEKYGR